MSMYGRLKISLGLVAVIACGVSRSSRADYVGPTPYLSFADSPFAARSVGDPNFYLETFEDGALNTPGVTASGGSVLNPGSLTDSVDGDDGSIDGFGTAGHSYYSNGNFSLTFTFDASALGGMLPTYAGIVLTDVGFADPVNGFGVVFFSALDAMGNSLGEFGPTAFGDGMFGGQTAEDRFFGVTNAGGISSITIHLANSTDWEVDHLQYGSAAVPEPASLLMLGLGGGGLAMARRFRSRRPSKTA